MITILNGDCLELMKDISANSVDLVICDLPYGCLGRGGNGKYDRSDRRIEWDIKIDLDAFWKEIKRIRRNEHTPTIHFCNTKFGYELIKSNEKEFRYDLVWSKSNAVGVLSSNKKPMSSHEMIYVFSKKGAYYNRIDTEGNRCVKSVINLANKKIKGGHPTQKPMELYEWLIARYCPPNGTVLDPTAGSCNSAFKAHEMGRTAIAIEKDATFYKKAIERKNKLSI